MLDSFSSLWYSDGIAPNFCESKGKIRLSVYRGILHLSLLHWTRTNCDAPRQWHFYRAYFPLQGSVVKMQTKSRHFSTILYFIVLRINFGHSLKLNHPTLLWKFSLIYNCSVTASTEIYLLGAFFAQSFSSLPNRARPLLPARAKPH